MAGALYIKPMPIGWNFMRIMSEKAYSVLIKTAIFWLGVLFAQTVVLQRTDASLETDGNH